MLPSSQVLVIAQWSIRIFVSVKIPVQKAKLNQELVHKMHFHFQQTKRERRCIYQGVVTEDGEATGSSYKTNTV